MIKDLHEIQALILKDLLFHNGSTFSKLNSENLDNNHFTFHIKHLVNIGLVKKEGSKYVLTTLGKQEAGLLDTESLKFERSGKVSVSITCKKQVNGITYYLIQQRLKEPFLVGGEVFLEKLDLGKQPNKQLYENLTRRLA